MHGVFASPLSDREAEDRSYWLAVAGDLCRTGLFVPEATQASLRVVPCQMTTSCEFVPPENLLSGVDVDGR